jgi:nucleoside-diphosphate-sugar epimerase
MRVLVTGGAGYLGSILVRKLLDSKHHVRVLDNLLYGDDSIRELLSNQDFELMPGDIRDMRTLVKAINGVDAVVHLAAIVGDQASGLDSRSTVEINYLSTKNIAELCRLYDVEKFVFASTCTVYGAQPGKVLTEKSKPMPFSLYGETKFKSENAILSMDNFSPTILRMGTLYGLSPRMRFDLAVNLFIAKAIQEKKITVFGGNQNRPFLHVEDAANAYVMAIRKNCSGLFNLGGENMSIIDVAKKIKEYVSSVEIEINLEIEDKRDYMISSSKIRRSFGFKNKKTIEDAVLEIENAYAKGVLKDYTLPKYRNFDFLFSSAEVQRKVYTLGPIFERSNES